ncbi:MAG TPA: alpha/beta hydrolase domain-containing protein [Vicinamibacterales bacterium]|jgi:hypothetical protein
MVNRLRAVVGAVRVGAVLPVLVVALFALLVNTTAVDARVVKVVVDSRAAVAGGLAFGAAGAYERIAGRVFYAFDPSNPQDRQIVDLSLAPRNAAGEVEAWGEVVILRPVDASRSSGLTLVDVTNRGNQTTFVFHLGARRDLAPDSPEYYGDALLLRRGVTIVAIGWQWDVPPQAGLLHFHPPAVGGADHPVTGMVRCDVTVDTPTRTISLGHTVGASRALAYPVADQDDAANVLTVRDDPVGERRVVPRSAWRFAREDGAGTVTDDPRSIYMADGFQPGKIYEAVYRAKEAVVVGTGLAAVRDIISFLKYDPSSPAPTRFGIAYGVSQTGRLLRHFLYQGFNADEQGRRAYDGIFSHTAGAGRGSFNHRFAQPSRDAQPYTTFFYPTDVFPFTSVEEVDPDTGARDGLLSHAGPTANLPKVFYVDGGYEYWGRAASLTHTTVDGRHDVGFTRRERRYVIASAQHSSPAPFPPPPASRDQAAPSYRGNVMDQRLALRALFVALSDWVVRGTLPPPSSYPTLARGELTSSDRLTFPKIPGVAVARIPAQPYRMDFGPHWTDGIVELEPPRLGAPFKVLVPRVDGFGNDAAGIRSVELRVPLATYLPWHLRTGLPAGTDRLMSFTGTFIPLPRTERGRTASGDARPAIARLYPSRAAFLTRVDAASRTLVRERFMLPGDVPAARQRMAETWDWIAQQDQ